MADKTLESLVPPLDLCNRLFASFNDSVLVWASDYTKPKPEWIVIPRRQLESMDYVEWRNAPTLEEIMAALARLELCPGIDLVVNIKGEVCGSVNAACRDVSFCGGSLAAAALRLWFDVKGRRDA